MSLVMLAVAVVATTALARAAPTGAAAWRLRSGEVKVTCPLTVGGSFEAKTTSVTGEYRPGGSAAEPGQGALVVNLSTLETGIALRDEHMRDIYLEVGKGDNFSRAVLSQVRLGGIDQGTLNGRGTFSGTLRLHGVEHPVAGQAEFRRTGAGLRVRATFPLKIAEFGIATPRYLGVGVKDELTVQVAFESTTGGAAQ